MEKMNYMLITVINREISTEQFPTFEAARETMLKELGGDVLKNNIMDEAMWKTCAMKRNYANSDKFAFSQTTACSNLDKSALKDWLIVGLD